MASISVVENQKYNEALDHLQKFDEKAPQQIERDRLVATWLDVAKIVALVALLLLPRLVPFFSAGWGLAATAGIMVVTFFAFQIPSVQLRKRAEEMEQNYLQNAHFYQTRGRSFSFPVTEGDLADHGASQLISNKDSARKVTIDALDLATSPATKVALNSYMARHVAGGEEPWRERIEKTKELGVLQKSSNQKEYKKRRKELIDEINSFSPLRVATEASSRSEEEIIFEKCEKFERAMFDLKTLREILRRMNWPHIPPLLRQLNRDYLALERGYFNTLSQHDQDHHLPSFLNRLDALFERVDHLSKINKESVPFTYLTAIKKGEDLLREVGKRENLLLPEDDSQCLKSVEEIPNLEFLSRALLEHPMEERAAFYSEKLAALNSLNKKLAALVSRLEGDERAYPRLAKCKENFERICVTVEQIILTYPDTQFPNLKLLQEKLVKADSEYTQNRNYKLLDSSLRPLEAELNAYLEKIDHDLSPNYPVELARRKILIRELAKAIELLPPDVRVSFSNAFSEIRGGKFPQSKKLIELLKKAKQEEREKIYDGTLAPLHELNAKLQRLFNLTLNYPILKSEFERVKWHSDTFFLPLALAYKELQKKYGIKRKWPQFREIKEIQELLFSPEKYLALESKDLISLSDRINALNASLEKSESEVMEDIESQLPRQHQKMMPLLASLELIQAAYTLCEEAIAKNIPFKVHFEGDSLIVREKLEAFEKAHAESLELATKAPPDEKALKKARAVEQALLDEMAEKFSRKEYVEITPDIKAMRDLDLSKREGYDENVKKIRALYEKIKSMLDKMEMATSRERWELLKKTDFFSKKERELYPFEKPKAPDINPIISRKVEPLNRNMKGKEDQYSTINKVRLVFLAISYFALPIALYFISATSFWISFALAGGSVAINLLSIYLEKKLEKTQDKLVTLRLAEHLVRKKSLIAHPHRQLCPLTPELGRLNHLAPLDLEGLEYTTARLLREPARVRQEMARPLAFVS